jgi:pyruvate formate lyase activating enzyme
MVTPSRSIGCHRCIEVCPTGAAEKENPQEARRLCIVCGRCVEVCPSGARRMVGKYMSVDEVVKEVERDIPFYYRSGGGVTITGGEPLMQADFVAELLKRCQEKGVHTALETCGYSEWGVLKKILQYVDLVLYDIKHLDADRHKELTGVGNELILQNATKAALISINMIIRVPVIPGHTDSQENTQAIAEFVRTLEGVKEIHLLPYHRLGESKYDRLGKIYEMKGVDTVNGDSLDDLKKLIESYHLKVQVGG